jgi:hypothetical protein
MLSFEYTCREKKVSMRKGGNSIKSTVYVNLKNPLRHFREEHSLKYQQQAHTHTQNLKKLLISIHFRVSSLRDFK